MTQFVSAFAAMLLLACSAFSQTATVTIYQETPASCEYLNIPVIPGACERLVNIVITSPDTDVIGFNVTISSEDAYGNPIAQHTVVKALPAEEGVLAIIFTANEGNVPMQATATSIVSPKVHFARRSLE